MVWLHLRPEPPLLDGGVVTREVADPVLDHWPVGLVAGATPLSLLHEPVPEAGRLTLCPSRLVALDLLNEPPRTFPKIFRSCAPPVLATGSNEPLPPIGLNDVWASGRLSTGSIATDLLEMGSTTWFVT